LIVRTCVLAKVEPQARLSICVTCSVPRDNPMTCQRFVVEGPKMNCVCDRLLSEVTRSMKVTSLQTGDDIIKGAVSITEPHLVECTLYIVLCTLHIVQCPIYRIPCRMYRFQGVVEPWRLPPE
jgi:hypothetical protein